ncbi:NAD(P)-dependent alcohol dehydrogenase [Quadrisphaera sp. DSM 44207]|uniref:NAD(P)-dependent alcohol dehydrogenase n=1 Tax=Quadrisphaera sp. DSM 44207 TaxID=1881057 RepID=UPI000881F7C8|nr:NAD(P)-dependent alcohol dehydrogenase [Quadrisphaera sp. DSM 44207]SDQ65036.1 L-iditol 2-dehydrogenase [Quadrisphaera sp. DSM 44207]
MSSSAQAGTAGAGTQRVAVLDAPGSIVLERRPVPAPGPGQVAVRVAAVGICGSDVHYFEHGRIGDYVVEGPLVLGHEASGTVTAAGEGVDASLVGRRVAIEPQTTCGRCEQCRQGRYNLCPHVVFFATPPVDGAFTEEVVVDAVQVHPVPDALSDEEAALVEPLAVAVHACRKAPVRPGARVLVSGAGPVGLLCLQVALAHGASEVVVTDVNAHRLSVARELGATGVVDVTGASAQEPAGPQEALFDVVLECSGFPSATLWCLRRTAPAGTIVLIGMGAPVPLPVDQLQAREITLTGVFRYRHVYPTAIELAASGKVRLAPLVTSHHGLDDVEGALRKGRTDPRSLKAVVHPGR